MHDDTLHWLTEEIARFQSEIGDLPVTPKVFPEEIRTHLAARYDFRTPVPASDTLTDVADMMRRWNLHVTHPRYLGNFNPSVTPISVVADALVALYNPQMAVWSHAPAAIEIERHVLDFFMKRFGLDPETGFANFTSGGAEANLTAVLVALTHNFPQFGSDGVTGQPTMYVSADAHGSFGKAAHCAGIGRRSIQIVPTDAGLKMDVDALVSSIRDDRAAGKIPFSVAATAGTTTAGVIDPLPGIAAVCREEGLWFHVDAAWGGGAILSNSLRPSLAGIELADSITWDAHKWLSVPMGAGMFFCRHRQPVLKTFKINTDYMPLSTDDAFDPYSTTLQWSRRFTGLKVFLSLATIGLEGYATMIEHQTAMGELLRQRLTDAGWTILNDTPLPVVNFTHPSWNGDRERTHQACEEIVGRGRVWISDPVLSNGRPSLRACITSYHTSPGDIEILMDELAKL